MTLEQLKQEAQAKLQTSIQAAKEAAEMNKYKAIISGGVDRIMAQAAVREETSEKLKSIELLCSTIVSELPIQNRATRETRKWNPSRVYGYGNQVGALVGILSGIQYSANEHKLQMLAQTGLNEQIIEDTLNAFGAPAYFSEKYDVIVDERPFDINSICNCLEILEFKLDLTLDKSLVTEATLSKQFELARIKAETARNTFALTRQIKTVTVEE